MNLPFLDTEQRTRLTQYRNNLIITLMEMKGLRDVVKVKGKKVDNIVHNHVAISDGVERKFLTEIYYISILTEQQTFENKYKSNDGIEKELLEKTALEIYNRV